MFRRVVVPLDGSRLAECALPHAIALCQALAAHPVLLRVVQGEAANDNAYPADPLEWEALRLEAPTYLAGIADRLLAHGLEAETVTLEGAPVEQIVDFVQTGPPTLLVLSTHGCGGVSGWVLGGVAQRAALHARVSFLLVRAYVAGQPASDAFIYTRMLVPLDGSRRAECVLAFVEALARQHDAEIVLVSVVPAGQALPQNGQRRLSEWATAQRESIERYLDGIAERLGNEGLRVTSRVEIDASPAYAIQRIARTEQVDLMVMAAHGTSCSACWQFGAVPLSTIVYGETPLLVVQDLSPEEIQPTQAERAAREIWGH
ncbi:universal stress protein [Arhodomonas sp. AD133]|uniref:universal stress protein n=1 Tax=Arhodomonas sp. AD133 TaxID=3415009 RepID=UPI003EBC4D54